MKRFLALVLALSAVFLLAGCRHEADNNGQDYFTARVLKVYNSSLLVEVADQGNSGLEKGAQVDVPTDITAAAGAPEVAAGEYIRVVFNGEILETWPARLTTVFQIYQTDETGNVIYDSMENED